jgi:sarcosine oxidase, subunit gamma
VGVALAEHAVAGPEPVTLAALPFRDKLILRGGTVAQGLASTALGLELPGIMRSASAGGIGALWLGPDEWLLLAGEGQAEAIAASLQAALSQVHHAVVVVSDRMTGIGVAGARAPDVLNAGCLLDLHPSVFAPGAVTRTLVGKAPVVLHRPGEALSFELWVGGSLAPYLWLFLANAAREFGIVIAA